jgi:hypothetical protein
MAAPETPSATVSAVQDRGVYASAERWRVLRTDPAFVELVRLARVTNQLTLAWPPLLAPLEDQSPRARRERFAAFFYAAALLHEALHVAQSLGQYFRGLPQYRAGFAAIFGDKEITALRSSLLDRIRDSLVFHFDRECLAAGLRHFPEGETLIATAPDFMQGEIHFDIADDALLAYLFGDAPTEAEYLARVRRLMEQGTHLFQRFMRAAHSLIPAALREMGCYVKPVDRPLPPPDEEPAPGS